jgi:hypothetical protein
MVFTTMSAHDALAAFIAKMDALQEANARVAEAAAPAVLAAARVTATAGTTPEGEKWAPLRSGGKPLDGAAAAIKVESKGTVVTLRISTPFAFHQHGGSSGKFHSPKRKIIPDQKDPIPAKIKEAIVKVTTSIVGGN